jgi:hypothetical protein
LKGQCIRSNGGLYYERYEEFVEALYSLESNGPLNAHLGRNGRAYFKGHYAWPVIERKYLDMFAQLKRELPRDKVLPPKGGSHGSARRRARGKMEPLPSWFARRERNLPPGREMLDRVPTGYARSGAA